MNEAAEQIRGSMEKHKEGVGKYMAKKTLRIPARWLLVNDNRTLQRELRSANSKNGMKKRFLSYSERLQGADGLRRRGLC